MLHPPVSFNSIPVETSKAAIFNSAFEIISTRIINEKVKQHKWLLDRWKRVEGLTGIGGILSFRGPWESEKDVASQWVHYAQGTKVWFVCTGVIIFMILYAFMVIGWEVHFVLCVVLEFEKEISNNFPAPGKWWDTSGSPSGSRAFIIFLENSLRCCADV